MTTAATVSGHAGPSRRAAGRALWRRWTVATTVGETLGFAVPALTAAAASGLGVPEAAFVPLAVAAGALEGAVLGAAQARVLRRVLDAFEPRAWTRATAAAAALAWAVAMPLGVYGDHLPTAALAAGWIVAGAVLLGAIGTAQWLVLRRSLPRAALWIPANAAAWLLGLIFPFAGMALVGEDDPAAAVALVGVASGLGMAFVVAAATGLALVRLAADSR